jgi:hypothetical protein
MDLLELGTLYQSLERTVARYGDRPAYTCRPCPAAPIILRGGR